MINATIEIMIMIVLSSNSTKLMKIDTNNNIKPMNSEFRITLYNGRSTCFFCLELKLIVMVLQMSEIIFSVLPKNENIGYVKMIIVRITRNISGSIKKGISNSFINEIIDGEK